MAIDFNKSAALAERLIGENGRAVTLVKISRAAADVDKPWQGPAPATETEVEVTAVFVTPSNSVAGVPSAGAGTFGKLLTKDASMVALVAASSIAGHVAEEFEKVIDGDTTWRISQVNTLQPGGVRIYHEFGLETVR